MFTKTILLIIGAFIVSLPLSAETLVRLDEHGTVLAGAAVAWTEEGSDSVVFTLGAGYSSGQIAAQLREKLSGISADVIDAGNVRVSGLAAQELYARLSFIELKPAENLNLDMNAVAVNLPSNPIAELPDGSSSIRATEMQIAASDLGSPEKSFEGVVVEVKREKDFPFATVFVKITRLPELKEKPHTLLKAGESYLLHPFMLLKNSKDGMKTPDWSNRESMANVGVWHMKPGDVVTGEIMGENSDGFNVRYVVVKK